MNITQAILPVAGLGTRFLPWTKVVPKELLPLGSRPIIAHLVEECLAAGISDICFVISKGKESIPQYFQDHPELEEELKRRGKHHLLDELPRYDQVRFHVVYQDEMKGDGHALLQAAGWAEKNPIGVLFGDDLIAHEKSGLEQLREAYEHVNDAHAALLGLEEIDRARTSKYGIIDPHADWTHPKSARLKKVRGLVEKPSPKDAPSTFGIVGKYIIPATTIDALQGIGKGSKDGEIRLIDALIKQLKNDGTPIYGHVFEGKRLDTGTPEGYKEAVRILG